MKAFWFTLLMMCIFVVLFTLTFSCGDDDDDDDEALCSDTCDYLQKDCQIDCLDQHPDITGCAEGDCKGLVGQEYENCIDECTEPLDQCDNTCKNAYDDCMAGC